MDHVFVNNIRESLIFKKISTGMFQRFVYPSNGKNYYLQVIYSPHSLYVGKVSNFNYISSPEHNEHTQDFFRKIQTIEGSANVNANFEGVTNNRLVIKIGEVCKEIQSIITTAYLKKIQEEEKKQLNSEFCAIKSISMLMKLDNYSKLYLVAVTDLELNLLTKWTTSEKKNFVCKIEHPKFTTNNHKILRLKIPNNSVEGNLPATNLSSLIQKKHELKNFILCRGCDHLVNKELVYATSYKMLMANHLYKCKLNGSTEVIPPIIHKIKSMNIDIQTFNKLKSFDSWLENEEKLCNDCFLENTL